ncbi:4Fe-4S dicluster domain-containing protein [Desulfurivibrio sp. D14AmB]|uniref:4Fe-4S dicluster domain-containing protein n=1 Tax=Desulfurivibrio sp. D14AmB TaxID=3374370 RepID=UPI00376EEA83
MRCSRRALLKTALKGVVAAGLPLTAFRFLSPVDARALTADPAIRWGFLVDTRKCVGCGLCVKACKQENEIPYDAPVSRTWVERYVVTRDGEVHIDSPLAARDGFTDPRIRGREIQPATISKAFFVPKLCNQCENPSCVQVCPVGATYKAPDGVVLVDRSWCIGCGYCVMACPYGVRFFHPVHKVAEKCNFCYHRIHRQLSAACVLACPFGARQLGNLKDPDDPVTKAVLTERVAVLKDEYGTRPQAFYLGLDMAVR